MHRARPELEQAARRQATARRTPLPNRTDQVAQRRYRRLHLVTAARSRRRHPQGREGEPRRRPRRAGLRFTMKRILLIVSLVVVAGAASGAGVRSATTAVERPASDLNGAVVYASTR